MALLTVWATVVAVGGMTPCVGGCERLKGLLERLECQRRCACLEAFGEDALPLTSELLRFTYIPAFGHARVVRVERREEDALVISKIQKTGRACEGGADPRPQVRVVPLEEWDGLMVLADDIKFWTNPDRGPRREGDMDGSDWILEGVRKGKYQETELWEPRGRAPQFMHLCERLAELGGVPIPAPDDDIRR
jgi:hypothetical protein